MSAHVLIVVAHPDDEVLGCGGTAHVLSSTGHSIRTCILSGAVDARDRRPSDAELLRDTQAAARILGTQEPVLGPFPNIRMNAEPHLALVQFIERAVVDHQPDWIVTHHPHDLNDDHRQVSSACQAAARLFQRGDKAKPLRGLLFMEIPSSTDWQFGGTQRPFEPNAFVTIGREGLDAKLRALAEYRDVMRPFPHPRSAEVLHGLAATRGLALGGDLLVIEPLEKQ